MKLEHVLFYFYVYIRSHINIKSTEGSFFTSFIFKLTCYFCIKDEILKFSDLSPIRQSIR